MYKHAFLMILLLAGLNLSVSAQEVRFSFCKSYCGKQWKLMATEEFGVEGDPAENMQKDQAFFGEDGKVKITLFGKVTEGKWVIDNTQTYISITNDSTKAKFFLKVLKSDDQDEMTLEFQDVNLVRTKMVYEKK
jgi:hypothetical protein